MDYTYDENNNPSGFEHCDISSEQACVGQDSTNYVYILGEGMSLWIIAEVYLQTSDNCEYESDGDARRKFWIKTLKETNLGVAQALFDP